MQSRHLLGFDLVLFNLEIIQSATLLAGAFEKWCLFDWAVKAVTLVFVVQKGSGILILKGNYCVVKLSQL